MKQSAFPAEGVWLKGNLHTHSTFSDGTNTPDALAAHYRERGYDFLAITDHNVYFPHAADLEKHGLIPITGVERAISYRPVNKGTDVVGIGLSDTCEQPYKHGETFKAGNYSTQDGVTIQQIIDMMRADGQYAIVAHPRGSRLTADDVFAMENVQAMEVFNSVEEYGASSGGNGDCEALWDQLLQRGKHIFAVAGDDTHQRLTLACNGWIVVKAKERTREAILAALYAGDFYASRGPEIYDFGIEDGEIYIKCSPCRSIHFSAWPQLGASCFNGEGTTVTEARYKLRGTETYVRARCVDERGMPAWTQPIWFT